MFCLQDNWRREQNMFCLKVRVVGEKGKSYGAGGKDGPNTVYTYEKMNKQQKRYHEVKN
jgi:hypothetical protein